MTNRQHLSVFLVRPLGKCIFRFLSILIWCVFLYFLIIDFVCFCNRYVTNWTWACVSLSYPVSLTVSSENSILNLMRYNLWIKKMWLVTFISCLWHVCLFEELKYLKIPCVPLNDLWLNVVFSNLHFLHIIVCCELCIMSWFLVIT